MFSTSFFAQDSKKYEELIEKALQAANEKRWDSSEKLFREALKTSPNDYRNSLVYADLGKVMEAKGENIKALESYTLSLNIAPEAIPILLLRANLYLSLGNHDKSFIDYSKIVELNHENTEALLGRAYIYMQRRQYADARLDYERVISIIPDNYMAQLGIVVSCHKMQNRNEALTRLSLMTDKYPDKAELYSIRADIEMEANAIELAIIDMNKAIELEPKNTNYILTRGYIHLKNGNKRLARNDFEQAISMGIPRSQLKEELKECK